MMTWLKAETCSNVCYTNRCFGFVLLISTAVPVPDKQFSLVVHCGVLSHTQMRWVVLHPAAPTDSFVHFKCSAPAQGYELVPLAPSPPTPKSHIRGTFCCDRIILSTTQLMWHALERLVRQWVINWSGTFSNTNRAIGINHWPVLSAHKMNLRP
jgi:hypothetical protein